MIIKSTAIYYGTYQFIPSALADARSYVLDENEHVFEIMPDCLLRNAGFLCGLKKNQHSSYVSFHPQNEVAAFLTESGMDVYDFQGNQIWGMNGQVIALLFSPDGEELWIVERINQKRLLVSVVEAYSGMENTIVEVEDSLYDSGIRLQNMPYGNGVLMELSAGQDGVIVLSLTDDGTLGAKTKVKELFPGHSHILPEFNPNSDRLLTLENDKNLYYSYTWEDLSLVSKQLDYPDHMRIEDSDNDFYPGYQMIYLSNNLAITQSANYRFYLFDPVRMERIEEVVIAGFEPLPTYEVFPNLNDETLYSTVTYFARHGGFLAAITGPGAKKQALIIFKEDDLLQQIKT